MAVTFSFSDENLLLSSSATAAIYRATSGGTIFSSNLVTSTNFDLFDDTSVVDDAIYFTRGNNASIPFGLRFNIGTALSATSIELVWEYYKFADGYGGARSWEPIEDLLDNTNSFQTTGSNSVRFPAQWQPVSVSINGSSSACMWVRVRIKSVTGLTEGGANTTDRIKYGGAKITASSSDYDTDKTSFEEIYQWMRTNQPHINIQKLDDGRTYDFRKISGNILSILVSKREKILLGQNSLDNNGCAGWTFSRLKAGTRQGNRGINGSDLIVFGASNSGAISFSSDACELYGSNILSGGVGKIYGRYPGYCRMPGTYVDCILEISPTFTPDTKEYTNVKINGQFVIFVGMPNTIFNNFTYVANTVYMFYVPGLIDNTLIRGLDWSFAPASSHILFYFYRDFYRIQAEIKLLDPVTPLPEYSSTMQVTNLSYYNPINLSKVFYYNSTSGTYTDYTTEASSTTTDDVPLSGEVGDMFYFGQNSGAYNYGTIDLETSMLSNDYEYKIEFYNTTNQWVEAQYVQDTTNGFGNQGKIIFPVSTKISQMKQIAVNGSTLYWIRLTITAKGTGTPTATRIRTFYQRGFGPWTIKEAYSVNLNIIDTEGDKIEGATVTLVDSNNDEVWSVLTDSNGDIEEQEILSRELHCDISEPYYTKDTRYSNYRLEISCNGYESMIIPIDTPSKINQTIVLKPVVPIRISTEGPVLALAPETGSSSLLKKL